MSYRWINQAPASVNPNGQQAYNNYGQAMQGPAMMQAQAMNRQDYSVPMPEQTQPVPAPGAVRRADVVARIQQLQAELATVESQIQELDRQNPGLKNMDPARVEIAAKRAEVGDMSAYDNMVQGSGSSGMQTGNAIENALMDAEKLTWGLNAQNTEDQAAARAQIEVAMRKAERDAAQAGMDVTKIPSYQRLRAALNGNQAGTGNVNVDALLNMLEYKKAKGTLTDGDREYVESIAAQDTNSGKYDKLLAFWKDSKGATSEDKAKAKALAARAKSVFTDMLSKPVAEQEKILMGMDKKLKEAFLRKYKWDAKTGVSERL